MNLKSWPSCEPLVTLNSFQDSGQLDGERILVRSIAWKKWRRKEEWNTTCCELNSPRTGKQIGFRPLTRLLSTIT